MSVAASGGGMSGSDDDNGAGEKKGKGISEIPDDHLPSTDGDTDDEDDEKEVESKAKRRSTLDCLASLESSLPMKRGLSSHYYGRSKSFGNLTEMGMEESKDLGKKEHAVNKRRRLLIAHEFHEKSLHGGASSNITHTSSSAPAFLSDHPKNEDEEDDNKDEKGNDDHKNQEEDGK